MATALDERTCADRRVQVEQIPLTDQDVGRRQMGNVPAERSDET